MKITQKQYKEKYREEIEKIFPSCDEIYFWEGIQKIEIKEDTQYGSGVEFDKLAALSKLFKTNKINIDGGGDQGANDDSYGPYKWVIISVDLE